MIKVNRLYPDSVSSSYYVSNENWKAIDYKMYMSNIYVCTIDHVIIVLVYHYKKMVVKPFFSGQLMVNIPHFEYDVSRITERGRPRFGLLMHESLTPSAMVHALKQIRSDVKGNFSHKLEILSYTHLYIYIYIYYMYIHIYIYTYLYRYYT